MFLDYILEKKSKYPPFVPINVFCRPDSRTSDTLQSDVFLINSRHLKHLPVVGSM